MKSKDGFNIRKSIILMLIAAFLLPVLNIDTDAEPRRRYKPKVTREKAINLIRASSETVSQLAGLEPIVADSIIELEEELIEDVEPAQTQCEIEDYLDEVGESSEPGVGIETIKDAWLSFVDDGEPGEELTEGGIIKSDIMNSIMDWLGTPYRFGGVNEGGIDCSAFVRAVYKSAGSIMLPRTARVQYTVGRPVQQDDLQFGDLVFFNTRRRVYVSHVGIYLGDNLFAHASSRHGVTVSSLESSYKRLYIGARRFSVSDIAKYQIETEDDNIKTDKQ